MWWHCGHLLGKVFGLVAYLKLKAHLFASSENGLMVLKTESDHIKNEECCPTKLEYAVSGPQSESLEPMLKLNFILKQFDGH